jgi:hypothetical protein
MRWLNFVSLDLTRMHFEWIILVLGVVIYLYIRWRRPSARFWRAAARYPETAYQWFNIEDCWHVVSDGATGPFRLYVPSLSRTFRIYGRHPDMEQSQIRFLAKTRDAAHQNV